MLSFCGFGIPLSTGFGFAGRFCATAITGTSVVRIAVCVCARHAEEEKFASPASAATSSLKKRPDAARAAEACLSNVFGRSVRLCLLYPPRLNSQNSSKTPFRMQLNSPHLLDKYGKILVLRNGAFFYFSAICKIPLFRSICRFSQCKSVLYRKHFVKFPKLNLFFENNLFEIYYFVAFLQFLLYTEGNLIWQNFLANF